VDGLKTGMRVRACAKRDGVLVGEALLGRVVDAFGMPIDGAVLPTGLSRVPLRNAPPGPYTRAPIHEPLCTTVRALDSVLPLGRGQRIGLFAGTGVGKSTLLGMLCRNAQADVVVVGLIGERGREVGDFLRGALGPEGLARSVVVAATSDAPPLVRARGALAATSIAEHFRAQGKHVLLVMDSVTRYAMALREAMLGAGEAPVTKGYPASVFSALPALIERAGTCAGPGAITAIYTVLSEGDDMQDPIADAVRGVLDGHVVLSRRLADRGHFPAIDVLRSVSRLMPDISSAEQVAAANTLRDLLAAHEDVLDLIQIGAYAPGADPKVDTARRLMPVIEVFLRQATNDATPRSDTLRDLLRLAAAAR
jgi:FliI/YscN family ATPase